MNTVIESFFRVIDAPYFWASMGMTTASAMFIGATLYNGYLPHLQKGLMTIFTYTMFLLFTNISRIVQRIISGEVSPTHASAYNGITTILVVTFFYCFGLVLGVVIVKKILGTTPRSIIKFKNKVIPVLTKEVKEGDRVALQIEYEFQDAIYPVRLTYVLTSKDNINKVFGTQVIETISKERAMKFVDKTFIIPKLKPGEYRIVIEASYDLGTNGHVIENISTEAFKVVK